MTWISRIGFTLDFLSINRMSTIESKSDLRGRAVCGRFWAHSKFQMLGWWNGRHVRLRGVCRKACGFKSRPEHFFIAKVHRLLVRRWQPNRRRREQTSEKRREDAHVLPKLRETESTPPCFRTPRFWTAMWYVC